MPSFSLPSSISRTIYHLGEGGEVYYQRAEVGPIWWLDGIKVLGEILHLFTTFTPSSQTIHSRLVEHDYKNPVFVGSCYQPYCAHGTYIIWHGSTIRLPRMKCHLISIDPPPVITYSSKEEVKMGYCFLRRECLILPVVRGCAPILDPLKSRRCSL